MDFDYKKYSLEQLETWVRDALVSAEVSPQEIYDTIKSVVDKEYHYFKHHTGRCYELLALLNGNGKGHIPAYDEYVEKKKNLVCDKDDPSPECQKSWNDFWEVWEENYYPEEVENDGMRPWGHSDLEYLFANQKKDKVKKWVLPVEECKDADTDETEYFVSFPDDLLEAADLKEGDKVEWIDNGDGSYLFKKVEKKTLNYQEAVDAAWSMTDDGFWLPPQDC
jgi:hypothetical protein